MEYYPNPSNACLPTSLCNLLLELGDEDMAEKVFENYEKNIYFTENGVYGFNSIPFIRSVTSRKYDAKMFGEVVEELNKAINNFISGNVPEEHKDLLTNANTIYFLNQMQNKNMLPYIPGEFDLSQPHLRIYKSKINKKSSHVVVSLKDKILIDNGKYTTVESLEKIGHSRHPEAVIEIFKS